MSNSKENKDCKSDEASKRKAIKIKYDTLYSMTISIAIILILLLLLFVGLKGLYDIVFVEGLYFSLL